MSDTAIQRRNNLYGFDYIEPDKRRRPEGQKRSFEIKQMWQRSHEILNLAARGYSNIDIADILNITKETVSSTINSELGQQKLSQLRFDRDQEAKKVVEKIRILTDRAIETYHEIFDSDHATLKDKKSVADTVMLELSGLRAPTKIQSHSVHTTLTTTELEEFKSRAMSAARDSGLVVEVESDPVDRRE